MRLRAALMPYLYTAARAAFDTGAGLLRPLYHGWPTAPQAYTTRGQFSVGPDLLAAPIYTSLNGSTTAAAAAAVWLPPGAWAPWDGAAVVASDGTAVDSRPYTGGGVPLFARAGALLPLALDGARDAGAPSPALMWTLFAGAPAAGVTAGGTTVYEDDGDGAAYAGAAGAAPAGALLTAAAFAWDSGRAVTVTVAPAAGGYAGAPGARGQAVQVRGWVQAFGRPPAAVTVTGAPAPGGGAAPFAPAPCWWVVPPSAAPIKASLVFPEGAVVVVAADAAPMNSTTVVAVAA
jgi:hypothetical protein